MRRKLRTMLVLAAGISTLGVPIEDAMANGALELTSGSSDIVIQDNGPTDLNPTAGQVLWAGTINGWAFTVTVGDTKPVLGSATSPQLDLSITANTPGNSSLVVKFTDTDFGPTSGSVNESFYQNGTSTGTSVVLIDPNNAQFGGSPSTSANLTGPYSITIVDTFTVGTISSDDRVTVPDGGTSVALLGFALMGVEGVRRRISK